MHSRRKRHPFRYLRSRPDWVHNWTIDNLYGRTKLANIRRFLMQNNEALIVLDELVKLANIQDERMLAMRAQERKSGFINPHLDIAIRVHEHLLLNIQKMRFDLGLDEYKRNIPKVQTAESAAEDQMRIYEAYKAAEEIFRRLGTRDVVGEERTSGRNSETEIN
jgi:hypothetical protein